MDSPASPHSLSLDGEWRLDFFPQPTAGAVRSLPLPCPAETAAATVPGCCELDLARAGLLPEPEVGLNVLAWRKYEGHQWLYSREFVAPEIPTGGRAVLRFEGIDTLADIFLDGKRIGETANMLVAHRFDVTARLRPGSTHTVQVLLRSIFLEAQSQHAGEHSFHMGIADGAPFRKAAHMGGWDIFPRLLVSGLWRGVALDIEPAVRLGDVAWTTFDYAQDPDGTQRCRVGAFFRVEAPFETFTDGAIIRLSIGGETEIGGTGVSPVQNENGQDAHSPTLPFATAKRAPHTEIWGTGVPPVQSENGQDARSPNCASSRVGLAKLFPVCTEEDGAHFLSPLKETDIHERNLPHWGQNNVLVFGTFRLADSLPEEVTRRWQIERDEWTDRHPQPWDEATRDEFERLFTERMEKWLDAGHGECVLRHASCREIVENALEFFDGRRYRLHAYVVMPNHVHVLFELANDADLGAVFHSWKSFTAKRINKTLGRTGTLWQSEYFDRLIRNARHYRHTLEYIQQNGLEVGGTGVPPVQNKNGQDPHSPTLPIATAKRALHAEAGETGVPPVQNENGQDARSPTPPIATAKRALHAEVGGTGVPPVQNENGLDAHSPTLPFATAKRAPHTEIGGTGVPPVQNENGQDARSPTPPIATAKRALHAEAGGTGVPPVQSKNGQDARPPTTPIATAKRALRSVHNNVEFDASGFNLWWPAGAGDQPLYDATIEIVSPAGEVLARDTRRIGFRTISLERADGYGLDHPGKFLFRVNGEPIFIRGTNWVPTDAIPCRQAERFLPTLELAEECHCNLVRVWGGGVYEPDAFYDWCDEHGILVWQDFMTGCAQFPQDDTYAAATAEEVRAVVLRLRNHPSLTLWAGNNENDESLEWHRHADLPAIDPNGDRLSREIIPRVLREFDPTRPYLPSSPYLSADVFAGRANAPERHLWGARDWYKKPFYLDPPAVFASETGWHGCPNRDSLERMMTPDCVYPWKDTGFDWNDEWRLKASNPFLDRDSGLWLRNDLMTNQVARMFGSVERDLDEFIAQSQFFQAEALKTMVERFRAGKFERFTGLVWWNVRDGWPQLSDAVVDWYGNRKAAFTALRDAQRDVLVLLLDDGSAYAVNDLLLPVHIRATFRDRATGAVLLEGEWDVPANASLHLGFVVLAPEPGVIDIEYAVDGAASERNHYLRGTPPFRWADIRRWLVVETVDGVVVRGHGVASGKAGDPRFPGGTVAMQIPFFRERGLDLSGYHPGTMNVDCAPLRFHPGPGALLFERVKWHPDMPAETFSFARARLVHRGARYPAWIYWPHPETKPEHFQPGGVAEVIAPRVSGLAYGDRVTLETTPDQAEWEDC